MSNTIFDEIIFEDDFENEDGLLGDCGEFRSDVRYFASTETEAVHGPSLPGINIKKAIRSNKVFARILGWRRHFEAIVQYLRFKTFTPDERLFAFAVARWQAMQPGLNVDGMLGPATWSRMKGAIGPVPNIDVENAVRNNRIFCKSLGWSAYRSRIARFIGFPDGVPNERHFALALARWQRSQRHLAVDGILGPKSLVRMKPILTPDMKRARFTSEALRRLETDEFVTQLPPPLDRITDEGHEVLTRTAATRAGFPRSSFGQKALVKGVRQVDISGRLRALPKDIAHQLTPRFQRRHALRRELCLEMRPVLSEIRGHLISLHRKARAQWKSRKKTQAFETMGGVLHLIQDSYSIAHMERGPKRRRTGARPIIYIRFYATVEKKRLGPITVPVPVPGLGPQEHGFPIDAHDNIRDPGGRLTEASKIATAASAEYLRLMRHLLLGGPRPRPGKLKGFLAKHFTLGASPNEPHLFHRRCR